MVSREQVATRTLRSQLGMTLIEIMIVMAILGGLMTVLGNIAFNRFRESKVKTAKIQMREIMKALDAYNLSCNSYPTTDQGLQALIESPGAEVCSNWGPDAYLKKNQMTDPFGAKFIYESDGANFELKSLGGDKKEAGEGFNADISSKNLE